MANITIDLTGKQYISQISLSDVTYYIKDADARTAIQNLGKGNVTFIGITKTALTDGAKTTTLEANTTNSLSKTTGFVDGDMVQYNEYEFIWVTDHWAEAGRGSKLGTLAMQNSATSSDYFAKSNHKHTVTGGSHSHSIPSLSATVSSTYTPAGTIGVATDDNGSTGVVTSVKNGGSTPTTETKTFNQVTNQGQMFTASVSNEVLTLTPGVVPTIAEVSVNSVTSVGSMPTFNTGTLKGKFTGTAATITSTGTTATNTTGSSNIGTVTVGASSSNSTVTVS